jgi:SAM-dependent methyltransferase
MPDPVGPDDDVAGRIVYSLGTSPAERDRLRRQSAELRDHSALLLDRVVLAEGWQAIDLGCGPSGILDLLADRVGPTGQVVGLDFEPANVALARVFTAERGLANVEVVQGDAHRTDFPSDSFDLVHARTLLINIPDPAAVVAEMVRLARPGGWVAVLEPDGGGSVCYPAHPAWDRLTEIFRSAQEMDGADTFIGRRLPELFRLAGLTDIGVEAKADIYPAGHSRRTIRADLVRSMRPKVLAGGIAGQSELDEVDHAVREHLSDPNTLMLPHLLFLAWGRKPADPSLRRLDQRLVAVLEHLVPPVAQDGVAGIRRQDPGPGCGAALLLDPFDARPAPGDVRIEGLLNSVAVPQDLGQHKGIFDGQAAALAHMRRCRMRGITDQDNPPGGPGIQVHPLDGPEVQLLIGLQRSQVLRNRAAETGEPATEPRQPARQRIIDLLAAHRGEAVRLPAADRDHADEAAIAQQHYQLIHPGRSTRYHAAPGRSCFHARLLVVLVNGAVAGHGDRPGLRLIIHPRTASQL